MCQNYANVNCNQKGQVMTDELYEKKPSRKWHQMTAEEKNREIEMLRKSRHYNLLAMIIMQQKLKQII